MSPQSLACCVVLYNSSQLINLLEAHNSTSTSFIVLIIIITITVIILNYRRYTKTYSTGLLRLVGKSYCSCKTGSIAERQVLLVDAKQKAKQKYSHDFHKHIFYLCIEGNKEHGLWLKEYNRQRAGKQEREYYTQQKRLIVISTHLQVLSHKHELLKRKHVHCMEYNDTKKHGARKEKKINKDINLCRFPVTTLFQSVWKHSTQ